MIGRIHSIESLSTVDGPGIRYVVFMQGCNLRCSFCHNPDTWNANLGSEITSEELVNDILNAKNYIKNGGVTFSGGEPLLQAEFLAEVCKKLKENGIHVAIDTAGNFDMENEHINELLKYVDLVLFDIKQMDSKLHKEIVGVDNLKILNMAQYISNKLEIPMWIRIVYLPGITDKEDNIEKYKKFIATLKSVQKVEVLPYHEMGKYKWKKIGIEYKLKNIRIPTNEEAKQLEKIIYIKSENNI